MSILIETSASHRRQRGVTLVELLISLVLGMLLTAGMIKVFAGNRTTYAFNQGLSRIQENARFALDHIAYNTRMAGYRGCISNIAIHNNLDGAANPFRDDLESGVQGYEADDTGADDTFAATAINPPAEPDETKWSPNLPTELDGKLILGSDVLVVRSISGNARPLVAPFSDSAQVFVATPAPFEDGDILVATDCQKASIFQLTNVQTAGSKDNLVHSASMTPGNSIVNWPAEQQYGLGAEVARLQAYAFYVGPSPDGDPALFQLRLQSIGSAGVFEADFAAEELIPGVDSMQLRYGQDIDADQTIDEWVTADAVADWTTVLSVEITLLVRATEEYGTVYDEGEYYLGGDTRFDPYEDRRLRQVFSTTIGLRNRLP